jgi:competence protein ComEC
VLLDRPALTLRTLAAAVVATLVVSPEAVLNPGFQMSFAATLALVSFYERWAPSMAQPPAPGASGLRTFVSRSGRWIVLGAATSFVAGLATAIYAAYHFHRLAPYGVPANVLTMPATSILIMPGALLGVALLPFGFDALGWHAMGVGIDWLIAVAKKIAALPGADGRIAAFGAGAVMLATAALLALCIPATRLRLAGIPLAAAAILLMISPVRYDVLVDAQADVIGVRGPDGQLAFHSLRRDRLTIANWLAADGVAPSAEAQARAFACDEQGCTAKLANGAPVAVILKTEALLEDCARAALIVSRGEISRNCATPVIDRNVLRTTGALGLRKTTDGWEAVPARSPSQNRPWFGRRAPPEPEALARLKPIAEPPARTLNIPDALAVPDVPEETSGEPELQ